MSEIESACACACGHDNAGNNLDTLKSWVPILIGGIVMAAGMLLNGIYGIVLLFVSYLLLGGPVLRQAWRDIKSGQVFGESFLMGIATLGAFAIGEYSEAAAVMLFYRVGEYFQEMAVDKSRRSIQDVMNLRPEAARVHRNGAWASVNPSEVQVGETILVEPSERIPLDGKVLAGESLLDTSALTGESIPESIKPGKEVMAGSVNQNSPLTIEVLRPLSESASSRILRAVEDAAEGKPKLENFITRFSKVYTPIVVGLAVLLAVIPPLLGIGAFIDWLYRALMFLVISCPCALVLSVPVTFFAGLARASSRGVLFKGANRMEALTRVQAAIFDKTGTLTHGVFEVQQVLPVDGFDTAALLNMAAAAEHHSPHPVAKAIREAAGAYTPAEQAEEITGRGASAHLDGKHVLVGNEQLLSEAGIAVALPQEGTVAYVAVDGVYAGCIIIADTIRQEAAAAVERLNKEVGYTAMLTGDAQAPALRVAKETGLMDAYYKLLPEEKLAAMQKIRGEHGSVAFIGDGMNDAPVLMGADVGIAIGGGGTDMAVEAADVVLLVQDLTALPDAVKISRRTVAIAKANILFAIFVKVLVMALGAMGIASMWMAVFADVGTALLCVLNALRLLPKRDVGRIKKAVPGLSSAV